MNLTEQIRTSLRSSGGMTMDQLVDANNWDKQQRGKAYQLLALMKGRNEVDSSVEEGKVCYRLIDGYVIAKSGRKAGPQIHVSRADKTPKPASRETKPPAAEQKAPKPETPAPPAEPQSFCAGTGRVIKAKPIPQAPARVSLPPVDVQPRSDFDLAKRIDAIAGDIEDALNDAVEAGRGMEIIKHLIKANGAINRAARAYPRT